MNHASSPAAVQLLGMMHGEYGRRDQQIIKPYMTIRLDDLLDLSRTPGAVYQSIHKRNAPDVDAGVIPGEVAEMICRFVVPICHSRYCAIGVLSLALYAVRE